MEPIFDFSQSHLEDDDVYLLPAALAAAIAVLSLIGAAVITSGGRPQRCVVPSRGPNGSGPLPPPMHLGTQTSSAPATEEDADAQATSLNSINFTPSARRSLSMPPLDAALSEEVHRVRPPRTLNTP